jgi:P4 family phage/plasmid primase-like protien
MDNLAKLQKSELASAPAWMEKLMQAHNAEEQELELEFELDLECTSEADRNHQTTDEDIEIIYPEFGSGMTDESAKRKAELLELNCPQFCADLATQRHPGLHYDQWFRWSSFFVHTTSNELALEFSMFSTKHNDNSETTIEKLVSDPKKRTRCATFGCSEAQIETCFNGKLRHDNLGNIINSPADHFKKKRIPMVPSQTSQPLEAIGIKLNESGTGITDLNGNLFAHEILQNHMQLAYSLPDVFFRYNQTYWEKLEYIDLSKGLRDILNGFVPNSWNMFFERVYMEALKREAELVKEFNTDRNWINMQNGMLNLIDLTLKPHDSMHHSTIQIPIEFDPSAQCPIFQRTLNQLFGGDHATINLIGEMFGYCLTAEVKAQKAFIFYGKGANGKSLLVDLLPKLCGQENVSSVSIADLDKGFSRSLLQNKLVNCSSENEVSRKGLNTQYFKAIVSGDLIQAEQKHQDGFSFRPFCKMVFALNNLPYSPDKSDGFHRRLIIIPFNKVFKNKDANINLADELATELPGIFNFALEGLKRLRSNNYQFTMPTSVLDIMKEYQEEISPLRTFIQDCIVEAPDNFVASATIGECFKTWCDREGHHTLANTSTKRLIREIKELLNAEGIKATSVKRKDRGVLGIKLNLYPLEQVNTTIESEIVNDDELELELMQ